MSSPSHQGGPANSQARPQGALHWMHVFGTAVAAQQPQTPLMQAAPQVPQHWPASPRHQMKRSSWSPHQQSRTPPAAPSQPPSAPWRKSELEPRPSGWRSQRQQPQVWCSCPLHLIKGAGLDGSGDAALSWHVHAELSLNNTWQEALVNQLSVLTNNVLLAEGHEVIKSLLLLVVVDSLLKVQEGGSGDLSLLSLLDLAHPDALTLRAAVLLHHPDSGGNALCPRRLVLCVPEGTDALGGARHHNENQLDAELPPQHAVQKILVHNHGIWPPCR
mmetsp:Transcript_3117/g.10782  ORF Transcript_3117/g.10782 Transcript_3117/m.10782 type:complete len:274 (-) Transcript_3117:358-1179(-)